MNYRIEHVGLMAKDTEALASWYEKVFGFRIVYKNKKTPPTFFVAPESGAMIEIFPYREGVTVLSAADREAVHLAIATEDFDRSFVELQQKGVQFIGEPKESNGVKIVFFQDPEGNWGQLIFRQQPLT